MEKLEITNFLNLKSVSIEPSEFTLLIGPQASGKSVIAKLLYFFKAIPNVVMETTHEDGGKRDVTKKLTAIFTSIFPESSWNKTIFSVNYSYKNSYINLSSIGKTDVKRLKIEYSNDIGNFFVSLRQFYLKTKKNSDSKYTSKSASFWEKENFIRREVNSYFEGKSFFSRYGYTDPIFIPSGRSFFSTLQNNVFTFLSNNLSIDYFLKEFGSYYDYTKDMVEFDRDQKKININEYSQKILKGTYVKIKNKEYIKSLKEKSLTNIANASSGQQEALPMLLVLNYLPFFRPNLRNSYFVEEPEAHLFPESQKYILEMIVEIFKASEGRNQYFLTTHSPYVLSTLNVLLKAGKLAAQYEKNGDNDKLEKLSNIVPECMQLPIGSTIAYEVIDGQVKIITDPDTGLIDDEVIDRVSMTNANSFDEMLELELGAGG